MAQEKVEMQLLKGAENVTTETRLKLPSLKEDCWTSATAPRPRGCSCGWGAPEKEETEHVRVDFVHATILER